tara:strand:+ start:2388 stop:3599 length:1212 start_codon:yes stop_codon:yes gene_type:complete
VLHAFAVDEHGRPVDASGVDASVGRCTVKDGNRTSWMSERVGPFTSTGGYDWWFLTMHDLFDLVGGERIVATAFMGTDGSGNAILYPPLHSHHTHVTPRGNDVFRTVMMEQHGDWMTKESECSAACTTITSLRPDYFEVTTPLQLIAAMNDVRPQDSPALTWYYQVTLAVSITSATGSVLSKHYVWSPAAPGAPFNTFYVPCSHESFMVFFGTLPWAGTSVRFNFHAHMLAFQSSWLFGGSPSEVGLPVSRVPWNSFVPADVGMQTNAQVHRHLMGQRGALSRLVCSAVARHSYDGRYDRHAHMNCTAWSFRGGAPFTVVAYNAPPLRSTCATTHIPQHAHWWITYAAADHRSHYTEGLTQIMLQAEEEDARSRRANAAWSGGGAILLVVMVGHRSRRGAPML